MSRRHLSLSPHDVTVLSQDNDCLAVLHEDDAWARAAQERWGFCGVLTGTLDDPQAWLLVAPALSLPPSHPLARVSRAPEGAALVALHTRGDSSTCAKHLVQAVAARLVGRAACIDAMGSVASGDCATPSAVWLESVGFRPVEEASEAVNRRLRLELKRTVLAQVGATVRGLVEQSWAPSPVVPPEPSHRDLARPERPAVAGRS